LLIELQLSLFAQLALPISAIVSSGSKSAHAWVKLDLASAQDFRSRVNHILSRLAQFGVDQQNKNPSRYGRLPGALRTVGADPNRPEQKLLYLNQQPKGGSVFS
jgi:regulatory protein RepA